MRIWPWLHNPPVGVYIAIMGLVAACVSLRKEPSRIEKFLWIIVMTVLMVAEIRNLYIADADQVAKFTQISYALDATKNGLGAISVSLGQLGEIKSRMDAIDEKRKTERNPQVIADLQAQKVRLQQQADSTSKQLLFATITGIGTSLQHIGGAWYREDDQLISSPARMDRAELARRRASVAEKYQTLARPLMENAAILQQQLLQKLPSAQTPQDKTEAEVFARAAAGQPLRALEVTAAGEYLLKDLAKKAGVVP
jgi:hypothetical protein